MSNRRKLIVALGVSALMASFSSFAQQPSTVWRIVFLLPITHEGFISLG
jgi:hypothetical protein